MGQVTQAVLAVAVGFAVGVICKVLRLPLPAPAALPGVLAVVGIYLGGLR